MTETVILSPERRIEMPESLVAERRWTAGQRFALLPKGTGILLVPVPSVDELTGIAAGTEGSGIRDRSDRS